MFEHRRRRTFAVDGVGLRTSSTACARRGRRSTAVDIEISKYYIFETVRRVRTRSNAVNCGDTPSTAVVRAIT